MKPLNLDNSPCSPTSSNCVIWQGPDMPCIKLCKGDTISDVVAKLATELCSILDTLNITNYDLTCFDITACGPSNFQELIQFLIVKICELEAGTGGTTPSAILSDCPKCVVTVADCFVTNGQQTMDLVEYVNLIANRVCSIITELGLINQALILLDGRVSTLETAVVVPYTLPSFTVTGNCIPGLTAGTSYPINTILQAFINGIWCSFYNAVGSVTDINSSLGSICVISTDTSIAFNEDIMTTAYSNWIDTPNSLADSLNNLWIALCDLRSGYSTYQFFDLGLPESIAFTTTSIPNIYGGQTYTVSGVTKPKQNFFSQVVSTVQIKNDLVPAVDVYHFPTGYSSLTYTYPLGLAIPITVVVQASYDVSTVFSGSGVNSPAIENWVDGAIVKTVGITDTVQYESIAGRTFISGYLFDGASSTDVVNFVSADKVLTTPGGLPVEFRFTNGLEYKNISFMSVVTLNPGEKISLKFKTKDASTNSVLNQAQLLIQELIQN
jgi:hypothetical protein